MEHIGRIFEENLRPRCALTIALGAILLVSLLFPNLLTAQAPDQVPTLERPVPILTGNAGFFTKSKVAKPTGPSSHSGAAVASRRPVADRIPGRVRRRV